jgi:hypothetical protein
MMHLLLAASALADAPLVGCCGLADPFSEFKNYVACQGGAQTKEHTTMYFRVVAGDSLVLSLCHSLSIKSKNQLSSGIPDEVLECEKSVHLQNCKKECVGMIYPKMSTSCLLN